MEKEFEKRYYGYFIIDSGLKVHFDVSREDNGEYFDKFEFLYNHNKFPWEKGEVIWLGKENDYFILADRVIGFYINGYKSAK